MNNKIDPCDTVRNNLIAAAIGLQQCTKTETNIVPIPGGDRVIAIGTPAQVAELLTAGDDAPAAVAPSDAKGKADDANAGGLEDRIAKLRAALQRISETRFGWDGDCGVTSIADDALYDDEQAAPVTKIEQDAWSSLTTVDCPTCAGEDGQCDDCDGQGQVIVSRADLEAQHAQSTAKGGDAVGGENV